MKKFLRLFAGIVATTACLSAQASVVYQFSYQDDVHHAISGTFTGTANGNLITGLSDISVTVDLHAFNGSGNLYSSSYNYTTAAFQSGGAVASFDGLQNDFFFSDVDYPANPYLTNYLFSVASLTNSLYFPAVAANGTAGKNGWSLTAVNAVPEPASMALLGLGLAAVVCVRRKA